jgi:hypothetical protein
MLGAILWVLVGVIFLALYNSFLLIDAWTSDLHPDNKLIKDYWHGLGAAIMLYLSTTAWYLFGLKYFVFMMTNFWVLFGGIVHVFALNRPFFFVGTTAKTDILFRKVFPKNTMFFSGLIKSIIYLVSLIYLVW